jgi:ribosomal protein S18 acetylase RimI-like enzyme
VIVRDATAADVTRVAELHAARISEGFLARLGPRFLRRLYRRVERSPHAFLLVAEDRADVIGFVAGSIDVRRFYRSFLARDALAAGAVAAPELLRSLPAALETLRYPAETDSLPQAEILAVAVDGGHAGQGVGRRLVDDATSELRRRGVQAAKVVAGADNTAALRLYESAGFARRCRITVHRGTDSEVLVWSSSSLS